MRRTGGEAEGSTHLDVRITVNEIPRQGRIEARTLLVHFLRDRLGLTGTHIGCDTTNCGACAVLLDGRAVKSCTVLAAQADGHEVVTIEGLFKDGKLHPVQEAFLAKHGLQCGFCTPGMILAAAALLTEHPHPREKEIRTAISGNLCRCTGYDAIIESVRQAARTMDRRRRGK